LDSPVSEFLLRLADVYPARAIGTRVRVCPATNDRIDIHCKVRGRIGFGSPTPSPSWQQREQRSADHLADGQSFCRSEGPYAPNQAVWKLHRECQLGFAWRDRLFQPLSLFEVPIGLTRRYGAVSRQLLDRIGELIDMQQQVARTIEALGFLSLAGAWHLS
jgi:hypothetical protein